jgi:hypothetical protein
MFRGNGDRSLASEYRRKGLGSFLIWFLQGVVYVLVRLWRSILAATVLCIGNTSVSVVLLPHDVAITYWTLIRTRLLGRNVKILAALLLLVPLVAWPAVVLAGSVIGGPVLVVLGQLVYGDDFKKRNIIFAAFESVRDFAEWNYRSYFGYLREFRERTVEKPFDINVVHLLECIFAGLLGILIDGTLATALGLRSFFPILWHNLKMTWSSQGILSRRGAVFFTIVWPFALLALIALGILGGAVAGLGAAVIVWEEASIHAGFV